jgi:hypothetical protein
LPINIAGVRRRIHSATRDSIFEEVSFPSSSGFSEPFFGVEDEANVEESAVFIMFSVIELGGKRRSSQP